MIVAKKNRSTPVLPPATYPGQVLLSVDGVAFTSCQPLTQYGWLMSDLGIMLVMG